MNEKPHITKMEIIPVTDEQRFYLKGHYKLVKQGKIKRGDLARQMGMNWTTLNHILLQMGLGS